MIFHIERAQRKRRNWASYCTWDSTVILHCHNIGTASHQATELDPNDAAVLSNRSLCWLRAGQAERALEDAKACRALRPDWAKACYREGAAHRLLQVCEIERCDWEFTHSWAVFRRWLICLLCVVTLAEVWGSRKCLLWGRATWAGEQRAGQRIQVETSPALFRYGHGHAELCFVLVHVDVSNVDETNNKQRGHRSWEEIPWGGQAESSAMRRVSCELRLYCLPWLERCWWVTSLVGFSGMFRWNLMGWWWGTQVGVLDDQEVRMYAKFFELCDGFCRV
jgi:tetratricopeptide (TPR) repeat protein